MYLKSIEVQGFKSFANRTVFQFDKGITGIVGPNGSGKSNVADAVRWVLGEQRVKQLRGGSMQDVIFAGTAARKALGYAYVALTLDNSDHMLPVSYEEITIARRLYRSGESEYLINKTPCRLKDIYEMFYDTGIGREGYSIIGQGQVEKILSGKPEERRELFDEAAGIVKFKRRKLEASRKLDNEQQNLLRVNDILSELTRQIGPLKRQSEKARIYLRKKEELKAYDVNLFLSELEDIQERLTQTRENEKNAKEELLGAQKEAEEIRARYEETSGEVDEIDRELNGLKEAENEQRLALTQQESRIELLEEQIRTQDQQLENGRARLEEISKEQEEKRLRINQTKEGFSALHERNEEIQTSSAQKREAQEQIEKQLSELEASLEESTAAQMKLLSDRTQIQTQQQHCKTLLEQISIRRSQLSGQILELKSEEEAQREALEKLKLTRSAVEDVISHLSEQSEQAGNRLQTVQESLSSHNQQIEILQEEYHKEASRLETMRNIAERYDGYGNSIRRVMEQKGKEKALLGVVADLISTQKHYETAIETALGGSIQNIVTGDEETAKRMIAFLKENRYGRATFLPLNAIQRSETFKQTSALNEKGVIGLASTLVKTDGRYAVLVSHLLGRTLVVDHIDHAVQIARKYKYSLRIVTLDGESLSPGGSMTGGAFKNSSNLLGRRREIEELQKRVQQKDEQLQKLKETVDSERDKRNQLRDEIRELSQKLQERYLEKNTADMKVAEMEKECAQTIQISRQIQSESSLTAEQAEDIRKDQEDLERSLDSSQAQEEDLKRTEEEIRQQVISLRESQQTMAAQLEQILMELAVGSQREEYLLKEIERFKEEIADLEKERSQLLRSREESETSLGEKKKEIAAIRGRIAEHEKAVSDAREKAEELAKKRQELSDTQRTFFDKREEISTRTSLLDREVYRLGAQIERMEENRENRISYMWEEYELTPGQAQDLRRDDLGSKTAWRRAMSELKKEIRELGNVNVNAIEEYKEVSERHEFLSKQQQDLIRAEEALRKIIRELDTGMRAQFKEQFARIQEAFDKSFKQLFGGGQGSLELVEEEDILEAGIRIIAQPPGKKLQNMMQLSGGEKALTAIALLFAIQNLKPSPFCLLDEIEAALDESNVDRYAQYLRKLTKHTQFIIITHRRGTMTAADRLYGITMQEKGISALVSVDLIEGDLDK